MYSYFQWKKMKEICVELGVKDLKICWKKNFNETIQTSVAVRLRILLPFFAAKRIFYDGEISMDDSLLWFLYTGLWEITMQCNCRKRIAGKSLS